WQSQIGRETLQKITKKVIPAWKDGLRPVQEDFCSAILDGEDVLCCSATGGGKSAAFSVPILALHEYNKNPTLYPAGLRTRLNPVGIVVTPTKGLASNIVLELGHLNVAAFAYSRESLAEARRSGVSLADEIKGCEKWQVVCVDPEHLKTKEWREISEFPLWRDNVLYGAGDEVHLIKEWGADFRVDFRFIGLFFRGRLPATASVVALSATLAPGKDTSAVCQSLGLFDGQFHLIRRTNERPNIHFVMQTLSHGLSGYEFPDIIPFLKSRRKTIFHFNSLEMLFRFYVYIWRSQPRTANKMRRTRMYTSLCSAEYNRETIRLIDEDPECQIVLATIAFANGIHAKSLLDSVTIGCSTTTLDIMWQGTGRAGREEGTQARGVVLVQKSTLTLARKYLDSPPRPTKGKGSRKHKHSETMNLAKAQLLTESNCYIAFLNTHYENPPLEISTLDCLAAKRPLPCSLCLARSGKTLSFPAPASTPTLPAWTFASSSKRSYGGSRKLKLTRKEREKSQTPLNKFRNSIRSQEHKNGRFLEHPQTMFLPASIQTSLLDNLLLISSLSDMEQFLQKWRHRAAHAAGLYRVVTKIQKNIRADRE
ncbi:P-loop containing nucleoside triphosphate hydrolase protein, partial [Mycena maculata]